LSLFLSESQGGTRKFLVYPWLATELLLFNTWPLSGIWMH